MQIQMKFKNRRESKSYLVDGSEADLNSRVHQTLVESHVIRKWREYMRRDCERRW
jgi:hypothetical protein